MIAYLSIIFSLLLVVGSKRWHTSQIVLMQLYDLQQEHMEVIENYLDLEEIRLEELKKIVDEVYEWRPRKISKNDLYLHNINVIKLMSRVNFLLQKMKDLMNNTHSIEVLKRINEHKHVNEDHVIQASRSIRRLQHFYTIPTSDMAAGKFMNKTIGDPMNLCECYVILENCFKDNIMICVVDWAIEAYKKWKNEGHPKCIDIEKLNEYTITLSTFSGSHSTPLIDLTVLHHSKSIEKLINYFSLIKIDIEKKIMESRDMYNDERLEYRYYPPYDRYIELCKGGKSKIIPTKYSKCRYQSKHSLYRKLMPFKEEDINSDPSIKIYHDVIYDDDILKFKTMALETMDDSRVKQKSSDSGISVESTRVSQVAWINKEDALGCFDSLDERIESFTGLSTSSAENYQIVNYGLGGHYAPHCDAFQVGTANADYGNRLVTVLFYLSDVENDGYTAFPLLNIVIPAEKGAALVFENVHKHNGEVRLESQHAACPILKGNKWISTKWLREAGNHLQYKWKNNNV